MSAVVRELSSASVVLATGLAALNLSTTSALRPSRLSSACSPSSSLDAVGHGPARKPTDPPPRKWSTLSYGFAHKEDQNAEEELQAGRDRRQAAAG